MERTFYYEDNYLREAFKKFDVDNKDLIKIQNIKDGCKRHGHKHEHDKVQEMLKIFTHDDNNREVDFETFKVLMKTAEMDSRIHKLFEAEKNRMKEQRKDDKPMTVQEEAKEDAAIMERIVKKDKDDCKHDVVAELDEHNH